MRAIDGDVLFREMEKAQWYNNADRDEIAEELVLNAPTIEPEQQIVRCKDCKHWRQQTNYQGVLLSFGFCESDAMWCSLYGETTEVAHIDTDDDFYCGYAERRTE